MSAAVDADEGFRRRVREFLAEHAEREGWLRDEYGRAPADNAPNEVRLARNKRCLQLLHEAGLGAISWPQEYGGQGLTTRHQVIFNHEAASYSLPLSMFIIGHGMCAPTVLAFGTDEQKRRYLPPLLRGEEIWCQLFSEPEAGSDLAAVRCHAERKGDGWVVTGQKVWTSGAHNSAYGLLLARTNPDAPRHGGLTAFIVDMADPDVEVRGLREMTGAARFNEVFFNGCHLPPEALLGDVGGGWRCAITTLMNERVSIGASPGGFGHPARVLIAEAARRGADADPAVIQRLMRVVTAERLVEFLGQRVTENLLAGKEPGPEGSLAKLASTQVSKASAALAMEILGPGSVAWEPENHSAGSWSTVLAHTAGLSIAGGTDEIMKNIVAERVLGLPREPRPGAAP